MKLYKAQGLCIAQRSVSHLLDRYDELVGACMSNNQRLQETLQQQQCVILAIDGMQPDVGHEVLWVIRECISGEILKSKNVTIGNTGRFRQPAGARQSGFACSHCGSGQ